MDKANNKDISKHSLLRNGSVWKSNPIFLPILFSVYFVVLSGPAKPFTKWGGQTYKFSVNTLSMCQNLEFQTHLCRNGGRADAPQNEYLKPHNLFKPLTFFSKTLYWNFAAFLPQKFDMEIGYIIFQLSLHVSSRFK